MAIKYMCDVCGAVVDKDKVRKIDLYSPDYSCREEMGKDICNNCFDKIVGFVNGDVEIVLKRGQKYD